MKKRLLACLMTAVMLVTMLPTAAFAADNVIYIDADGNTQTCATATEVTNSDSTWNGGWYVASGEVTIGQRVTVTGDVHLILADGCTLTINGGIQVQDDDSDITNGSANALTIYGQQNGTGTLTAQQPGYDNAGIGGGSGGAGGTVTINGGTVNANSDNFGAGIGGGRGGAGGTIIINDGTVTITSGNSYAAGIGGGGGGNGGNVTINGGIVNLSGRIGYGVSNTSHGSGGTLTINGGTLKNATSRGSSFTITDGTLENCTIQDLTASVDSANHAVTIKGCTFRAANGYGDKGPNISSWNDANATIENSTFNFKNEITATLNSGGTGNTYNGAVTIMDNASFGGNTTFNGTVAISGDNTSFSDNTTFKNTVAVAANKNVTFNGDTTLTGNVTVGAGGSLTNSGTFTVPRDCTITNHGTLTNNEGATINLSGTINDEETSKGAVTNNGTILLVGNGQIIDYDGVTGNIPVPSGTSPVPAGEIVIDLSTVTSAVTIGPKEYTIDGTSHAYDPAQSVIVLTGTYGGNVSSIDYNPTAAVMVLENTTASITLRNVNIGWEKDNTSQCSSIWAKDNCAVTVFLEGNNTLKPKHYGCGIRTEERSSLTVEGTGTLNLDLSNSSTIVGIGQCGSSSTTGKFGSITINGGNIVTTVGTSHEWVAGIGGTHGTITVNGGTIMGGKFLNGMNLIPGADYEVVINGGTINIEGSTNNTYDASGHVGRGSLTINGGVVSMPWLSTYGKDGSITINGGQVTTTHSNGYLSYTAVINGGTVTGKISVDGNNKVKINGGSAKLTQYVYNSEGKTIASVTTSDGKTAYRTELTGQTSVASVLVDGKSQNISYNHPSDTSLYLYLVHDDSDSATNTHKVIVMDTSGKRTTYTATWNTDKFEFGTGSTSTPTDQSSIGMTMTGTTTGEDGKPEKTYGDAKPVVITVNLTTQTNNALPPANGPMLAAENSLPYAFKTVILLCNGKEIQRKDVPENQTSVVFYVQTQAWTPGEYKFTATYGGDATTGSSAIAETSAPALNIVGQKLDKNALTVNVAVSGTYGQKVSELAVSGTVTQSGLEIPGTWAIGAVSGDPVLDVGTSQALTATFTPSGKGYDDTLTRTVTPTIGKKELTATISGTTSKTYDGNTTATGLSIALADVVSGDTVSATATITYDNANVGDNKTITASGITLTGTDANNYKLASNTATTTGSITQATIGGTLSITGTATYGQTLTASYTPTNSEAVSYQWKRGGSDISGATGNTYTLGTDDVGQTITVTVTPTDTTNYTGSVTSSATATVSTATPTVNVSVSMSGDAGSREAALTITITGVTGGAAPTGTVTLTGDSNSLSNPPTLSNGTASYTWTGLTDGEHKIKATYNGDGNYGTASPWRSRKSRTAPTPSSSPTAK